MLYGLYVSAAGAMASSYRQDVIANNIANADTVAFKRDIALLKSRATEAQHTGRTMHTADLLEGIGGGTFALPTFTDFSAGPLEKTGNDYDLALTRSGFLKVQNGQEVGYTRDGRLMANEQGTLVTVSGDFPVLDDSGATITIDRQADFVVDETGVISQNGEAITKLALIDFLDTTQLKKVGGNLYTANENAVTRESNTVIKQGFIEGSGIDAITQITKMMKAQGVFRNNVKMLQMQAQTLGYAVTRLGSIKP